MGNVFPFGIKIAYSQDDQLLSATTSETLLHGMTRRNAAVAASNGQRDAVLQGHRANDACQSDLFPDQLNVVWLALLQIAVVSLQELIELCPQEGRRVSMELPYVDRTSRILDGRKRNRSVQTSARHQLARRLVALHGVSVPGVWLPRMDQGRVVEQQIVNLPVRERPEVALGVKNRQDGTEHGPLCGTDLGTDLDARDAYGAAVDAGLLFAVFKEGPISLFRVGGEDLLARDFIQGLHTLAIALAQLGCELRIGTLKGFDAAR